MSGESMKRRKRGTRTCWYCGRPATEVWHTQFCGDINDAPMCAGCAASVRAAMKLRDAGDDEQADRIDDESGIDTRRNLAVVVEWMPPEQSGRSLCRKGMRRIRISLGELSRFARMLELPPGDERSMVVDGCRLIATSTARAGMESARQWPRSARDRWQFMVVHGQGRVPDGSC